MLKGKFIDYIRFEKRFSDHTVKSYTTDLDQFTRFLNDFYEGTDPSDATYNMVRSWVVNLNESGLAAKTIHRKLSSLNSFYRFLLRNQIISSNPAANVPLPKPPKTLPDFVDEEAMEVLFKEIDFGYDFKGYRDRLIMELFYQTGIRVSELINLSEHDVDFFSQTIRVFGKRRKERIIPLTQGLCALIAKYLQVKKNQNGLSNVTLLVTEKDRPLYHKLVYRNVNNYLTMVTTISRKSPHIIRHTFATHMLNRGADINAIKELLGHANLAATQIYTHNTIEKLRNVHKQAHPRA